MVRRAKRGQSETLGGQRRPFVFPFGFSTELSGSPLLGSFQRSRRDKQPHWQKPTWKAKLGHAQDQNNEHYDENYRTDAGEAHGNSFRVTVKLSAGLSCVLRFLDVDHY